ncbi:MAG: Na/Pi cotransporter family protein [Oscillospiraceae bacterium]|jgi:phosphate:Na+ symporter
MDLAAVLSLLCGICVFIYGMSVMGQSLKRVAGDSVESLLRRMSSTPAKGALFGAVVTAVIQSSSATSVTIVGFVNARMMTLSEGISVIIGSLFGTSATGWVLSLSQIGSGSMSNLFSVMTIVAIAAIIGTILMLFSDGSRKQVGNILMGFSVMMIGMETMSSAIEPLSSDETFINTLAGVTNPLVGILAGIVLGAVTQSSSAGVGILQTFTLTGALTYSSCIPLMLGVYVGSSLPVILAMIGSSANGKRAAISYFICNTLTLIVFQPAFMICEALGIADWLSVPATFVGVALLNSLVRLVSVILLSLCSKGVRKLTYVFVKYQPEEEKDELALDSLTDSALKVPGNALNLAISALETMTDITYLTVDQSLSLFSSFDKDVYTQIAEREDLIDKYQDRLGSFTTKLIGSALGNSQMNTAGRILNSIGDIERIGDHAMNVAKTAETFNRTKVKLPKNEESDLNTLLSATDEIAELSFTSFRAVDPVAARKVEPFNEIIGDLCSTIKERHVKRITGGMDSADVGLLYNDIITDCERISGHCANLAFVTVRQDEPSEEEHSYSEESKFTEEYRELLHYYSSKYIDNLSSSSGSKKKKKKK